MITDDQVQLSDGRSLGYAEYGDLYGVPLFFFHGSAGSRYEAPLNESILKDLKIRLITTDRPGHGISDLKQEREILDVADDIGQLADNLDIEKFHVIGWSAGGPYALACPYKLKERVISGAIVSGLAPPDRPHPYNGLPMMHIFLLFVMRNFPGIASSLRKSMYNSLQKNGDKVSESISRSLIPEDKKVFEMSGLKEAFMKDVNEGYRQSWKGVAIDDKLINKSWGFDLKDVHQRIDIWQGDKDRNVTLNQAKYQHSLLPNSRLHIVKNEGHLFLLKKWREVISKLFE